ncbi:MAG: hypothetical protein JO042_06585 [Sinobacteraceae bacterium]|nr:hypothetical protein [Nevskiaceae bacterium]
MPIFFTGTVVTSAGSTYPIGPPTILVYPTAAPAPFLLASDAVVEGDFEFQYLPKDPMVGPQPPRDEDTLFVWSYNLRTYEETPPRDLSPRDLSAWGMRQMQHLPLVGVTFFPKQAMKLLSK